MDGQSWQSGVAVVLVEPGHAGNVAATARVMVVNGFVDLRLVNPMCGEPANEPWLAWGAGDILRNAKQSATLSESLQDVVFAVGCTRRIRRRGWPHLTPGQTAQVLQAEASTGVVALVFGPERTGLRREHLELCHARSAIPQHTAHPSYNLSHAVAIYAYELLMAAGSRRVPLLPTPAAGAALEILRHHLEHALAPRGPGGRRLARDLYRLWIRARPTSGELRLLHKAVQLMAAPLTGISDDNETPRSDHVTQNP